MRLALCVGAWVLVLTAAAAAAGAPCQGELSLSGDWTLSNANGSISLAAPVPGYALSALRDAGVVDEPLYRFNEIETRWVLEDTWTYTRQLSLPDDCLAEFEEADLYFLVVDTTADVFLNGQLVAHLNTAHRPHRLSVRGLLLPGNNSLAVVLHPAVASARAAYEAYSPFYEIPTNLAPGAFEHYNFIRKPASDFGWDWGPAFAPVGLPADVSLLLYNTPFLRGVHVQQVPGSETTAVLLECELLVPRSGGRGTLVAAMPDLGIRVMQVAAFTAGGRQFVTMEFNVSMSLVKLWWPAGHGDQPLYTLLVSFQPDDASPAGGAPLPGFRRRSGGGGSNGSSAAPDQNPGGGGANTTEEDLAALPSCPPPAACAVDGVTLECCGSSSIQRRIGFRTIELVTDPLPKAYRDLTGKEVPRHLLGNLTGESFYFRVNGVPIFIKGANLIPLSIMRTDVTLADWRAVRDAALGANMNMLRVWGGGLYQEDIFYDMCDAAGLMVWQEFLYACAPYPLATGAVQEAETEASYQVRRLAGHPSIAVWGGNNEIEASIQWFNSTLANPLLYAVDHERLFSQAIGGVMRRLDPHRPYVDTSPSNGVYDHLGRHLPGAPTNAPTKRWGDVQDPRYGDVHFYDYINDAFAPATYPAAKFVSEFGYQSFPSWHAIRPYTEAIDRFPFSRMSRSRQRHPEGDAQLVSQLRRHFRVPDAWTDAAGATRLDRTGGNSTAAGGGAGVERAAQGNGQPWHSYQQWIYLTQLQQALAYNAAFGRWRRGRSEPQALTMGILYWQLNDIWPGYSWSSVNYGGRWKLLHYAVRRAYAPLSLSGVLEDGQVKVYMVNDLPMDVTVNLTVRLVSLSSTSEAAAGSGNSSGMYGTVVGSEPMAVAGRLASHLVWAGSLKRMGRHVAGCRGAHRGKGNCFVQLSAECVSPCQGMGTPPQPPAAKAASIGVNSSVEELTATPDGTRAGSAADIPVAAVWLSEFKDMALDSPDIVVDGFEHRAFSEVCFNVSSATPAVYVVLDTELLGHFSDNALPALLPGQPVSICFLGSPGSNVTVAELSRTLVTTSLFEHQEPLEPGCRRGGGSRGGAGSQDAAAAGGGGGGVMEDVRCQMDDLDAAEEEEEAAAATGLSSLSEGYGGNATDEGLPLSVTEDGL